jgi:hypothetical protein
VLDVKLIPPTTLPELSYSPDAALASSLRLETNCLQSLLSERPSPLVRMSMTRVHTMPGTFLVSETASLALVFPLCAKRGCHRTLAAARKTLGRM